MFTDTKMQVAAGSTVGLKITRARKSQSRLGGRSEVCRTPDDPGKIRRDGIEDFGRGVASGDSLAISWKNGNVLRPVPRQFAFLNLIELLGKLRKLLPVLCELLLPLFARFAAPPSNPGLEVLVYPGGTQDVGVGRPTVGLLHQFDLVFAERLAVRGNGILTMRRTIADVTIDDYDRWSARRPCGIPERVLDAIQIVGIPDTNDVPSIRQKPPGDVLGERDIGLAFDGDVIVVVDPAEVIEFQVPGNGGCLARDSFHHAAIAAECVNAVSEQFKIWLVVTRGEPLFRNGHAHTRGHTLSQRTGRCFHARWPASSSCSRIPGPDPTPFGSLTSHCSLSKATAKVLSLDYQIRSSRFRITRPLCVYFDRAFFRVSVPRFQLLRQLSPVLRRSSRKIS